MPTTTPIMTTRTTTTMPKEFTLASTT
jgi:hypothetical protein